MAAKALGARQGFPALFIPLRELLPDHSDSMAVARLAVHRSPPLARRSKPRKSIVPRAPLPRNLSPRAGRLPRHGDQPRQQRRYTFTPIEGLAPRTDGKPPERGPKRRAKGHYSAVRARCSRRRGCCRKPGPPRSTASILLGPSPKSPPRGPSTRDRPAPFPEGWR